jgi:hypothetical protein
MVASAMALSDADGTVHARAGVRVALTSPLGETDRTAAFRPWLSGRMASLRQCFTSALTQNSRVSGQVTFDVRALGPSKLEVKLARDEVHDELATSCVRSALSSGAIAARGARAQVTVTFDNPVVRLGVVDPSQRRADVRVLGSGLAETSVHTQGSEVHVDVTASAYARSSLAQLGGRAATDLAGLLDCRRKASRRARPAQGTVTVSGFAADGHVGDVRVVDNTLSDRRAPACVSAWLAQLDVSGLEKMGFSARVTFSK